MNSDSIVHVQALGEVFLKNGEKLLEDTNELVIRKIKKDNSFSEFNIIKTELPKELLKVFEEGVTDLKKISIRYIKDNVSLELNSISII